MNRINQLSCLRFIIAVILTSHLLVSCSNNSPVILEVKTLFSIGTMFPNVYQTEDEILISYIQSQGDTIDQLFFTAFDGKDFSIPKKVAEGKDWFVNWADIPAIAKSGDNIIISWLDKSADGTYDYDIKMSISNDNGTTWNEAFIPHRDSIAAEHGFLSLDVDGDGNFVAVWLDGRNTKTKINDEENGAMTLRSAIIHSDGSISNEVEIDNRVCDCCQTSVVQISGGIMAAYRNRSEDEVRDNYFTTFRDGHWSESEAIYDDKWEIAGCPVNGPVLASDGSKSVAAWYTEGSGKPEIYLANFDTARQSFSDPILISDYGVMGRIDLMYLENGHLMVTWLEDSIDNMALIRAKILNEELEEVQDLELATTVAARDSGLPKIARIGSQNILVYTDVEWGLVVKSLEL